MRRLPIHKLPPELQRAKAICPQMYSGCGNMQATPCTKCSTGWDEKLKRCGVEMGVEHFPLVSAEKIPNCPLQHVCQHQVQLGEKPCPVRARGFICESAIRLAGVKNPEDHPLGFNADMMATPEDLAEQS